jgi:hypothetical protein
LNFFKEKQNGTEPGNSGWIKNRHGSGTDRV